ncbi:uncharacterized protein LOC119583383 [Penaeus monodon]|uniref:uncharacterized protein LOC119583383 n=1 Tax=Penaeus monodon TaxID=6687 RepID=UPI0018A6E883|nr:uncharacterized protein LOC119583383 [Penaeus monodon]
MGQGSSYPHPVPPPQRPASPWAVEPLPEPARSPHQVRQRLHLQPRDGREQVEQQERRHQLQQEALAGCCGSGSPAAAATTCSCGGGLTSTAAIYGTAAAPDPVPHPVVVTPPRAVPHHHHHLRHQLDAAVALAPAPRARRPSA